MSRRMEFHGEVYHGTSGDIAKRVIGGGGDLLLSRYGAAGPGAYVTEEMDAAQGYGDHVLRGTAHAYNVMPYQQWLDSPLSRGGLGAQAHHADRIRQHLLDRGYDAIEDGTERRAVSLLKSQQFEVNGVFDPNRGHFRNVYEYMDEPGVTAPRRRASQRERLWTPKTEGH